MMHLRLFLRLEVVFYLYRDNTSYSSSLSFFTWLSPLTQLLMTSIPAIDDVSWSIRWCGLFSESKAESHLYSIILNAEREKQRRVRGEKERGGAEKERGGGVATADVASTACQLADQLEVLFWRGSYLQTHVLPSDPEPKATSVSATDTSTLPNPKALSSSNTAKASTLSTTWDPTSSEGQSS